MRIEPRLKNEYYSGAVLKKNDVNDTNQTHIEQSDWGHSLQFTGQGPFIFKRTDIESDTKDTFNFRQFFKKQKNIQTIQSFAKLTEGWNGYHAQPFDATLLNRCIGLIKSLEQHLQPDIFPTARNSIQFEYEDEHGHYLEIEIFEDHYEYFYENLNGREAESKLANWDEIFELIYEYYITTPH